MLKQDNNNIVSQHSIDIRLTHLEEMIIKTDPELPPVASKPYPLPLKHHKFVKEEIENLLEAGIIERAMSPYAAPKHRSPKKKQTKHNKIVFLWNRTLVAFVDKLSSTTVDFIMF